MHNTVDRFISAITAAAIEGSGVFAEDAVLDATVPNWRFTVTGAAAIEAQLAGWFADPGVFEELRRTPLPAGELLEFTLAWMEDGEPQIARQVHVLELRDGLIVSDRVWCGGRWGAALQAEMAEAALEVA